jgi:hypothetical protein
MKGAMAVLPVGVVKSVVSVGGVQGRIVALKVVSVKKPDGPPVARRVMEPEKAVFFANETWPPTESNVASEGIVDLRDHTIVPVAAEPNANIGGTVTYRASAVSVLAGTDGGVVITGG